MRQMEIDSEEWRRYVEARVGYRVGLEHYGHEIGEIFQNLQDSYWLEGGFVGDLLLYLIGASIGYEAARRGKAKGDMLNQIPNEIMEARERAKREAFEIDNAHKQEDYRAIRKLLGFEPRDLNNF